MLYRKASILEIKTINNHSNRLILFFAGWGMDEKPFLHLSESEYDVIIIYNYTNFNLRFCSNLSCSETGMHPNCPIYRTFKRYGQINVVAFGYGVWVAALLFDRYLRHLEAKSRFRVLRLLKKISKTVAVNGTLCPVSNIWGVPQKIFNSTLKALNKEVNEKTYTYGTSECIKKFNLKMFAGNRELLARYRDVAPRRGLEDIYNELVAMKENYTFSNAIFWNRIIICNNDTVIPAKAQERFWSEYEMGIDKSNRLSFNAHDFTIEKHDAPHFPFFNWKSWDEII